MQRIAHLPEELIVLLRRGLSPLTDNRNALMELGFERAYPQIRAGYEATIWERSIEHHRQSNGYRVLARERAYLIEAGSAF